MQYASEIILFYIDKKKEKIKLKIKILKKQMIFMN